ncbi:hypothetical protein [Ureibacillus chungkukjangi]|uniref:Uncharacterized protein n=1 Tax=Ureibacillus chungkukjangi TaxID=1202712 RepID=A0A318TBE9_9BACL|nr:hypothetical protein [Ureibacillus chungkukjangi]MCM3390517.1 hypothetical protein [Ureibacillus chungkukjangi]PYF02311.1 hypothetical protein BJ095_1445 [Ureibacillus chungkukjangi]
MLKRIIPIVFLLSFFVSFLHIDSASAAPKLDVSAEVGISNKVKYYTPLPLKLTITNSGSAFSGDLVIDAAESYSVGSGLVYPIDIAEGETKTIQLYLNGLSDDYMYNGSQQPNLFYFYEGGIEKGKAVKYTGTKAVRPQFHDLEASFVYTLTENSDRLSALQRLRQFSTYNVEVFHVNQLKKFEMPAEAKGLAMADVIAVDEISLADYTEKQQQAIYSWVESGGTLLIGASDQVEASSGIFKEHLPLVLSNEKVTVLKESLAKLSNNGIFPDNIEVYQAQEKEGGKPLLADGDTILASSMNLGSGRIIQTTFSLGDQPLAGMDGYVKLIGEILDFQKQNQTNSFGMFYGGINNYVPSEVGSVNELFPSFEISTTFLVITIVIYILFIGPLLYFILKKLDKREHAWWAIPLLSIGLSLAMFIFGAKDRLLQSQIQQSAFYKVEGENLVGHYIESILTNKGGDFTFTTDENTTAVASRGSNYYSNTSTSVLHEKSYVQEHANGSTLNLRNLNYWSVQSIVGQTKLEKAGNMDIQLTLKDGKIEGTITNHFPFKLNEVAIWSGTKEIVLGDIEANATLEVSEEVKNSILLSPSVSNYNYTQPQSKEDLMPLRLEKLKYGAAGLVEGERLPTIIAWTEDTHVGIELDGSAKVSPVAYIAQSFEPVVELSGEFTLDKESLEGYLEPTNGSGYMELMNESTNEWYLDKGDYDYIIWAPDELLENTNWTELSITNKAANRTSLSVWNWSTSKYEDILENSASYTTNLEQYISAEGQLKILVRLTDDMGSPVKMPDVEIKGVAK